MTVVFLGVVFAVIVAFFLTATKLEGWPLSHDGWRCTRRPSTLEWAQWIKRTPQGHWVQVDQAHAGWTLTLPPGPDGEPLIVWLCPSGVPSRDALAVADQRLRLDDHEAL